MTRSQRIYVWQALLVLLAVTAGPDARPSDACSTLAVSTSTDVAGTDGSTFSTRSYFQTADFAAIQHVDKSIVAVEGPFGWAQSDQQFRSGDPFYKTFALGHQYHAILLNFDDIVSGLRRTAEIRFGDADLIATPYAPDIVIASRGELTGRSNATVREQFRQLFARLEYTAYQDIEPPIVDVSEGGDLGWIGVNVRASGSDRETGTGFDDQWAWIMIARKIDGEWLHVANASNVDR